MISNRRSEPDSGPAEQALNAIGLDPVCAFHGKRWSEHEGGRCLYCCICFNTLTPDECAVDSTGQKWDICKPCAELEWHQAEWVA